MDYEEELLHKIQKNNGILTSSEVTQLGIPRFYVQKLVEDGVLRKIERGIYCTINCFEDEMYCLQVKYRKAVFSHDTALFLHNFTDRNPLQYSLTVPTGYNTKSLKQRGCTVYLIKKSFYNLGLCQLETPFGRKITSYNIERTICDIMRSRNKLDITFVKDALSNYAESDHKNIPLLMDYANQLRVAKILSKYLRILL
jgi:predicted transcriptional regulator of viral defense system